jgi:serine protease Do
MKEPEPKGNALRLGITLTELTPQLMNEKRLTGVRGLYLKEVDPNGLAAERVSGQQALVEGDVITRINRVPVVTLADFQRVVNGLKPGDPVVLQFSRTTRNPNRETTRMVQTRMVQFTYQ